MFTISIYFKPMLSILPYNTRKKGKKTRLPHPAHRSFHPISFVLWLILCFIGLHSIHLYSYKCTFRRLKPFRHFYHRLLWIHPGKRARSTENLTHVWKLSAQLSPLYFKAQFSLFFSNTFQILVNCVIMVKILGRKAALRNIHGYCTGGKVVWNRKKIGWRILSCSRSTRAAFRILTETVSAIFPAF